MTEPVELIITFLMAKMLREVRSKTHARINWMMTFMTLSWKSNIIVTVGSAPQEWPWMMKTLRTGVTVLPVEQLKLDSDIIQVCWTCGNFQNRYILKFRN